MTVSPQEETSSALPVASLCLGRQAAPGTAPGGWPGPALRPLLAGGQPGVPASLQLQQRRLGFGVLQVCPGARPLGPLSVDR